MPIIPIFFAINNKFAPNLLTAIKSLKDYISDNTIYDIHILYGNLSENIQAIISTESTNQIHISFHNIDYFIPNTLKEDERWTREIYYRLAIPYLFVDLDKALYFDADLIFQKDPKDLFEIDLKDNYLGAVYEPSNEIRIGDVRYPKAFTSIDHLRREGYYFGSGVLSMNLKALRNAYCFEDIMHYIENNDLVYIDQDALNYLCLNHTYGLAPNWNCIYHFHQFQLQLEATNDDLYIYHYAGNLKPQAFALRSKYHLFWKYYQQTPFYQDEDYIKALTDMLLDLSDEIDPKQIMVSVEETFTPTLCQLYLDQINNWVLEGEVLSFASIFLLKYLSLKYTFEIDENIILKYDYLFDECSYYLCEIKD